MRSVKRSGRLVFPAFYFVSGTMMLLIMVMSNGALVHVGLLGILSILVSYGLGRMQRWSLYPLIILFFTGVTFGVVTFYSSIRLLDPDPTTLSFQALILLYIVLLVISFLDTLSKRGKLA